MKDLNQLVISLQDVFSNRLASVFIFGSKANTSDEKLNSNVDLFIIVDNVRGDDLTKLYPATKRWVSKGNPAPVLVGKEEFYAMADTYAIECSDLKWNSQLIYGDDLVQNLNINYFDLRLQCERELKHLIHRLRGFYLEHGKTRSAILPAIDTIAKTVVVLFRALIRLKNLAPSVYKQDLVEQLGSVIRFDKQFFNKLIGHKEKSYIFTSSELYDFNEYLINQLTSILKQVSEM